MNPSEPSISHFKNGIDSEIGSITSLWDNTVPYHLQKYKTGITTNEFLEHAVNAENNFDPDATPNW